MIKLNYYLRHVNDLLIYLIPIVLIVGIFLWDFTHQSGIHATIAGVLLALTIPHNIKNHKNSLLLKLEHGLSYQTNQIG